MSYVTPLLFNTVQPGLYRGAAPREINFTFLKTLNLNNIVSLTTKKDPVLQDFCLQEQIHLEHIACLKKEKMKDKSIPKVKRKKKPVPIEYDVVIKTIKLLVDKRNYPIYIHCDSGELVTSLVIACLRKLTMWSTVAIFNEFLVYNSSINVFEREFIDKFNICIQMDIPIGEKVPWIGPQCVLNNNVAISEHTGTSLLPKLQFTV